MGIEELKLGSLSGEFGNPGNYKDYSRRSVGDMDDRVSSKRARIPSGAGQAVSCLVDGCKADLSKCRDYHRRHKVCEMHSKTPKVTIAGNEQRFCQQCSRFHALTEFDEGKRSCRKRLEGHNRRRRKPQPETLPMPHSNFLPPSPSTTPGGKYLAFGGQSIIPTSSVISPTTSTTMWSGSGNKTESNSAVLFNSSSISTASYSLSYKVRQFPFLHEPPDSSATHMFHHNLLASVNSSSGNSSSNNSQKIFCNDLNRQVVSSDGALSLLSSSSAADQTSDEMGLGRIVHPTSSMSHQYGHFSGTHGQSLEAQPGSSAFVSNIRSSTSFCQDVFQTGTTSTAGSSTTGGHQTLSFSWE